MSTDTITPATYSLLGALVTEIELAPPSADKLHLITLRSAAERLLGWDGDNTRSGVHRVFACEVAENGQNITRAAIIAEHDRRAIVATL